MNQNLLNCKKKIELTDKQSEAWAFLNGEDASLSVLYGGAKGGGKSHFLCVWSYSYSKQLIVEFGIKDRLKDPIVVGFIGRKRSVDFANTTLQTWKRTIPSDRYTIREQAKQIVIDEKVVIQFGGLDDQETINKFNSAEFVFAAIDQAEETDKTDVAVLEGALRLKVNGVQPRYRMLYTANPAECWLKNEFDVSNGRSILIKRLAGYDAKYIYIPALYTDNEHLPDNYSMTLEKAFGFDEALLMAYKRGDWSLARDSDFVITRAMLEGLKTKTVLPKSDKWTAGCDPAIGGDECVFYILHNGYKVAEKILHETNTMIIAGEFVKFCQDNIPVEYYKAAQKDGWNFAGMDTCGLGIGIYQRCKDLGLPIMALNSASKATDTRCSILRDEIWLYARESVQKNLLSPIEDHILIEQITAFKFKIVSGKFKVMAKEGIKERIGSSPDRADAFAYAVYMMKIERPAIISSYKQRHDTDFDWRTC